MRKVFSITSSLLFAAVLLLSGMAQAQNPPAKIKRPTKVSLPCVVQATELSGNNFSVKLVATNNTGAWLQQGKKIYFTFGVGSAQSMTLGIMVPDTNAFNLKTFNYSSDLFTPQSLGCTAFYYK